MAIRTSSGNIVLDAVRAVRHPAFLFSAGNTALAVGQAHRPTIVLNAALTLLIYCARLFELRRQQSIGIPFIILVVVNLVTAVSIEANKAVSISGGLHFVRLDRQTVAADVSAFAYVAWAAGHYFAGRNEKTGRTARRVVENPQTYYGVGDIAAVNAAGRINVVSFPFMVIGFIQSLRLGRLTSNNHDRLALILREFTAARFYAAGYLVGAVTSLKTTHFAIAQSFWAIAYLQFAKDK